MKNILSLIILILIFNNQLLKGQNFKMYYKLEFIKDTITKNIENRDMVLWIEKDDIIFCSNELMMEDSIYLKNKDEIYVSNDEIEFMTIKIKNDLYKYHYIDSGLYKIKEKSTVLNWQIKDKTQIINGMSCQLATLKYKGREWEAWFNKDYPINYGPYIFHGLPGLIIELRDSKNNYIFSLRKIMKDNYKISESIFSPNNSSFPKSLNINYNQLKKLYLSDYSSPYKRMKEIYG